MQGWLGRCGSRVDPKLRCRDVQGPQAATFLSGMLVEHRSGRSIPYLDEPIGGRRRLAEVG